jgi:hypothetical protein
LYACVVKPRKSISFLKYITNKTPHSLFIQHIVSNLLQSERENKITEETMKHEIARRLPLPPLTACRIYKLLLGAIICEQMIAFFKEISDLAYGLDRMKLDKQAHTFAQDDNKLVI